MVKLRGRSDSVPIVRAYSSRIPLTLSPSNGFLSDSAIPYHFDPFDKLRANGIRLMIGHSDENHRIMPPPQPRDFGMNFGSDNQAGASQQVLEAVIAANSGIAHGYGG